ncbi:MAG TPA: PfkB family carbohydrate kinase, partial [Myxococcota bacterium]
YVDRRETGGGMVGNALTQAARLGCQAHVLSAVGDDADGRFVRRALRAAGVITRRLVVDAGCPTTIAVVQIDRRTGERRFITADRAARERGVPDFDLSPRRRRAVLLVDGHFPAQARRAVRRAREVGAAVVADFHRPLPQMRSLLPFVDYPVVPLSFAREYAPGGPRAALLALREEFGGTPIVTLGARGGLYLEGGRVRRFAAPRVRVRDTTGAGDAFHGAFAAALARGLALRDAVAWGARAGALCCTALGATGRVMTAAEAVARRLPRAR